MAADYIELAFVFPARDEITQDLLIAELGDVGYESFLETEKGLNAYIQQDQFDEEALQQVLRSMNLAKLSCERKRIAFQNWNQVWESNFQPVLIGDQCRIRASFHEPDPNFSLELLIDPKMSFGTGHHETTFLVASWLLELPLSGKKVLDMGCGTGVLGILAAKQGAASVFAADVDPICVENSLENAELNQVKLHCQQSTVKGLAESGFDLILANINRNVLLIDLPAYAEKLKEGGTLLLSGFYEGEDAALIQEKANALGLKAGEVRSRNRWAALRFVK